MIDQKDNLGAMLALLNSLITEKKPFLLILSLPKLDLKEAALDDLLNVCLRYS